MDWIDRFGDERIRDKALKEEGLRTALDRSLKEIYRLLESSGKEYRLEAVLTDTGENLVRMSVKYKRREERDRIWDEAARIILNAREEQKVDILCGIYKLRS